MKVSDLKGLIKECVEQLKEQFEHIELKKRGSLVSQKPQPVPKVDSGDQKMGPVQGNPPKSVNNTVSKVGEQKGAMNQMVQHPGQTPPRPITNTVSKVGQQRGAMNQTAGEGDVPVTQNKEQDMENKEVVNQTAKPVEEAVQPARPVQAAARPVQEAAMPMGQGQVCQKCGYKQGTPMQQDVRIEVPLPAEAQGAEVSAQVIPGEQGQGQIAELIIVDDQVSPQRISRQEIQIQIPDSAMGGQQLGNGQQLGDEQLSADLGRQVPGEQVPQIPGQQDQQEFGRFQELAGLK